jgi:hypothetical protein
MGRPGGSFECALPDDGKDTLERWVSLRSTHPTQYRALCDVGWVERSESHHAACSSQSY